MPSPYRGTTQYALIFAELIRAARYRVTVTYQELAERVHLPLRGAYMGVELGEYLGAISEDEVKQSRPMLSAIAINVEGKPGEGFYGLAKTLGRLTSEDPSAKETFWKAEKEAIYKTWQRSFPTRGLRTNGTENSSGCCRSLPNEGLVIRKQTENIGLS